MRLSLAFVFYLFNFISFACNLNCTENGCSATGADCPKESPGLIKQSSVLLIECDGCGKDIVTKLYSKFGCKSSAPSANGMTMVNADCLIKENTKQDQCPSGTNARLVDSGNKLKICLKAPGTSSSSTAIK